ncbi:MAG: hypothetical protein R2713_02470 [Ilumatobacteraceae bacterium]
MAGAKLKYICFITLMSFATVVAAVVSGIVNRYQLRRIEAFFNQDSNDEVLRDFIYQPRNAIRAIASVASPARWLQGCSQRPQRHSRAAGRLPAPLPRASSSVCSARR